MILDTSFVIDIMRKNNVAAQAKAREMENMFTHYALSAASIIELWRGALLSLQKETEKQRVNSFLHRCMLYNFGELEARKTAEIETLLKKEGNVIELEDIMIAATACARDEPLLTRNTKHFRRIPELKIETY
ncbi:MAG TPA: PIN domain-containing protein [Candidatus Nanoarchaeia archaeon]|nr:PIN domain-containing protein [Candidatus Nanoarchaeia archaeon]